MSAHEEQIRALVCREKLPRLSGEFLHHRHSGSSRRPAFGQADILDAHRALDDLDNRSGTVAPNTAQRRIVDDLGAKVRWNRFGTPQSLIRYGGYLGTVSGETAAAAARSWVSSNKALFRLSTVTDDNLVLLNESRMQQQGPRRGLPPAFRRPRTRPGRHDHGRPHRKPASGLEDRLRVLLGGRNPSRPGGSNAVPHRGMAQGGRRCRSPGHLECYLG